MEKDFERVSPDTEIKEILKSVGEPGPTMLPVVVDDALVVGLVLPLSLSVDHRIADGGETARFLNQIMDYLAEPVSLVMD